MTRLRSLIKEVLTVKPKKDCNCGCGGCAKKSPVITESRIKKAISEGLTYHVENKIPLHESVYRIGSEKHFELINEARKLWVRGLIDVSEDDQAILETHLGNFGMYEGEKVPLDMPMVNEENKSFNFPMEFKLEKDINYDSWGVHEDKLYKGTFVKDLILSDHKRAIYVNHEGKQEVTLDQDDIRNLERLGGVTIIKESLDPKDFPANFPMGKKIYVFDRIAGGDRAVYYNPKSKGDKLVFGSRKQMEDYLDNYTEPKGGTQSSNFGESLDEAKKKKKKKKKDPPLGKPKRGGSKAYYVYVRDPKTKKIKKVSFGSGGLRAKIKNKEARNAFAKRHNCKNKKDRTTAGYWSCNLPRYAEQLGLGSNMNTFW